MMPPVRSLRRHFRLLVRPECRKSRTLRFVSILRLIGKNTPSSSKHINVFPASISDYCFRVCCFVCFRRLLFFFNAPAVKWSFGRLRERSIAFHFRCGEWCDFIIDVNWCRMGCELFIDLSILVLSDSYETFWHWYKLCSWWIKGFFSKCSYFHPGHGIDSYKYTFQLSFQILS